MDIARGRFSGPGGRWFMGLISSLVFVGFGALIQSGCTRATTADRKVKVHMSADMKQFTYCGMNINYVERGSGPTMLLIHGYGASTYSWESIIDSYSTRYHTLAIDLKGFGLSDRPTDLDYSVREQSRLVQAFIKAKDLKRIILVGHSFGGAVALVTCLDLMGTDNPIEKLILIDSASYEQSFPFFISILRIPVLNRAALGLLPNRTKAKMVLKKAFFDHSKITDEKIDIYASYMGLEGSDHALIMTSRQIIPDDIASIVAQYKRVNIPVLIIWGRMDQIIPLEIGERLAREIPSARLRVIDHCGHVPQEERSDMVVSIFEEFLTSLN